MASGCVQVIQNLLFRRGRIHPSDEDLHTAVWDGNSKEETEQQSTSTKKFFARFTAAFRKVFIVGYWRDLVIDPSSNGYNRWLAFISLAVVYNLTVIIVRAVFWQLQDSGKMAVWFTLDYISDVIYLIDMFVQLKTGFLEQGQMVTDQTKLRLRYIHSTQFKLDIISLLPTDLLYLACGTGWAVIFRLNRLLRMGRLSEFFDHVESRSSYPNIIRISTLIIYILIIIHWNACFYVQLSAWIGFGSDTFVYWSIDPELYPVNGTFSRMYLASFFWSTLMMTTIADVQLPNNDAEYAFALVNYAAGSFIFVTIVGKVGGMITNMNANRAEFQQKLDGVKRYMEFRKVNKELETRVIKWFDYLWSNKQSLDGEAVLAALPSKLRAEIAISVHMETLRRVAIFQECEASLLVELVLKLKLAIFSPGDYVCRKGDIGKELYIIKRGRLNVVSDDGSKVFATLGQGTVFGEISVLNIAGNKNGNRRTANIRSVGYSDLFVLSKEDLWEALEEYPEARKMLIEKGRQLLRKDNMLDEEKAKGQDMEQTSLEKKVENLEQVFENVQIRMQRLLYDFELMQQDIEMKLGAVESRLRA